MREEETDKEKCKKKRNREWIKEKSSPFTWVLIFSRRVISDTSSWWSAILPSSLSVSYMIISLQVWEQNDDGIQVVILSSFSLSQYVSPLKTKRSLTDCLKWLLFFKVCTPLSLVKIFLSVSCCCCCLLNFRYSNTVSVAWKDCPTDEKFDFLLYILVSVSYNCYWSFSTSCHSLMRFKLFSFSEGSSLWSLSKVFVSLLLHPVCSLFNTKWDAVGFLSPFPFNWLTACESNEV